MKRKEVKGRKYEKLIKENSIGGNIGKKFVLRRKCWRIVGGVLIFIFERVGKSWFLDHSYSTYEKNIPVDIE